jgi:hypothetical protein
MATKNKPRTKMVTELVDSVNEYLMKNKIKDESNSLFNWTCRFLLNNKMYEGFNFFKFKENSTTEYELAGSYDPNKYDFLRIY